MEAQARRSSAFLTAARLVPHSTGRSTFRASGKPCKPQGMTVCKREAIACYRKYFVQLATSIYEIRAATQNGAKHAVHMRNAAPTFRNRIMLLATCNILDPAAEKQTTLHGDSCTGWSSTIQTRKSVRRLRWYCYCSVRLDHGR